MLKRGSLLFPINNNTVYGSELTHPAPVFYQKNIGKQQIIVQRPLLLLRGIFTHENESIIAISQGKGFLLVLKRGSGVEYFCSHFNSAVVVICIAAVAFPILHVLE